MEALRGRRAAALVAIVFALLQVNCSGVTERNTEVVMIEDLVDGQDASSSAMHPVELSNSFKATVRKVSASAWGKYGRLVYGKHLERAKHIRSDLLRRHVRGSVAALPK